MLTKSKAIIKRISPSTLERLEKEKKGDELLKEVINHLLPIYQIIEAEEYFEIQEALITLFAEPKKSKKVKDGK